MKVMDKIIQQHIKEKGPLTKCIKNKTQWQHMIHVANPV